MTMILLRRSGLALLVAGMAILSGCATSTVESRKHERYGAYSALTPELRTQVDLGQVKVGMTEDAVYIALGKPDQILQEETQAGAATRWLYHGTHLEEYRYWNRRPFHTGHRYSYDSYYVTDYHARNYIRSEVVFKAGVVAEWRTLPVP